MEEARPSRREGRAFRFSLVLRRLLGDINLAKTDNPCNGITDGSSTVQNHVEVGTIDAVMLCKSALTSFSLNCGPQQANNIVFIKHKRVEAQISRYQDRT